MNTPNNHIANSADRSWESIIKLYNKPDARKSIGQLCSTFIPYIIVWILMIKSMEYSYVLTLLLSLLASGLLVRIFIIFHDCGHNSFFKSAKANNITGIISGILAFTPYYIWHSHHRVHHATSANLDKRGIGDVWTMTREEYNNAPVKTRRYYRIFRNPFIMFLIGPLFVIFYQNRFTKKTMNPKEKRNIYLTNTVLLITAVSMSLIIGIKAYLIIQLPVLYIAHSVGIWLFLVQHNFEDVNWERDRNWEYMTAAIKGSSFLKLPLVFQWFTGSIGFHHIHHLSPRIPNYNLRRCHNENMMFRVVQPITFFQAFRFLNLHLWDEENQRMITFKNAEILQVKKNILYSTG
jgi:acyl-lipid omega-6 desaturase (Delta-12 desaturase)